MHIKEKNWECVNIRNNLGVVILAAVNGMNNGTIAGVNANQVAAVNTIIGADFIPSHTVWDEDWSIAGGHPTDLAVSNPNANNGG
ncbi:unnamed protein product [Rhizophagus irregularis]|nr:unnamed protein product [Rhizophagus irregularis]